jgi:hypothetical protein
MTMQHHDHPHDERLAALAGGDPDATADSALRAHVDACARCADAVQDLSALRAALAELPDLVPSRPLQLLRPVAPAPERSGAMGWLRRLAAPAMAAGAGLAIVGAVGLSAAGLGGAGSQGAADFAAPGEPALEDGMADDAATPSPRLGLFPAGGASPTAHREAAGSSGRSSRSADPQRQPTSTADESGQEAAAPALQLQGPVPWLGVLVAGAALFLVGLYLRFAIQPRAG